MIFMADVYDAGTYVGPTFFVADSEKDAETIGLMAATLKIKTYKPFTRNILPEVKIIKTYR